MEHRKFGLRRKFMSLLLCISMIFGMAAPLAVPAAAYAGERVIASDDGSEAGKPAAISSETSEDAEAAEETAEGESAEDSVSSAEALKAETAEETEEAVADESADASEDSKKKLTVMVYGVGADLERNNYALTLDMVEMIEGMIALKERYGLDAKDELPVNVIVETGGVSFGGADADVTAKKVQDRINARNSAYNDKKVWEKYEEDFEKIAGKKVTEYNNPQMVFKDLACLSVNAADPKEATGKEKTPDDIGEAIDWTKNQRYELRTSEMSGKPTDEASTSDGSWDHFFFKKAKNAVNDANAERSMTAADNNGVSEELYDFVSTTVKEYPADQYALILWDHGGKNGFGIDERNAEKKEKHYSITSRDIRKTLPALKSGLGSDWKNFAFAGYDACLMGDFDTVSAWDGYTRYLLASEDTEGVDGWYYIPFYAKLFEEAMDDRSTTFTDDSKMAAHSLAAGKQCIDDFVQWFVDSKGRATLALYDLEQGSGGNKGRVALFNDAINDLSEKFLAYLEEDPFNAYTLYFNSRQNIQNFNGIHSRDADFLGFLTNLKEECGDCEGDEKRAAVRDAADALIKMISFDKNGDNENGMIVHFRDSGFYTINGAHPVLCGLTVDLPYDSAQDEWSTWLGGNSEVEGRQAYKDFNGMIASFQKAGSVLKDVYGETEKSDTEIYNMIDKAFSDGMKEYGVSAEVQERFSAADIAGSLYDERIRKSDTGVLNIDGKYYSRNARWRTVDRLYQHGAFNVWAYATEDKSDDGRLVTNLGLGYLPDGGDLSEEQTELVNYGNMDKWFYVSSQKDAAVSYPAAIFESFAEDDDAYNKEAWVTVPYSKVIKGDDGSFVDFGYMIVDYVFEEGKDTGEIVGYRDFDYIHGEINSRYYTKEEIEKDTYVVPIYDFEENWDVAKGSADELIVLKDSDGRFIQQPMLLTSECVLHRGDYPKDMADNFKDLIVEKYSGVKKESTDRKYEVEIDNGYKMRDIFSYEYDMESTARIPQKATVMVYGIGSDLERKNHRLSFDLTEMAAGIMGAWNKLVNDKVITDKEDLPLNIIVETGGVSYDASGSEKPEDKMLRTIRNQYDIYDQYKNKYNDSAFKKYNDKIKELTNLDGIDSYNIYKDLTYTVSGNTPPTSADIDIISQNYIHWHENQRFELNSGFTNDDDPDHIVHYIREATNDSKITDRNRAMTYVDKDGVIPELYEFVSTTMADYPAEQYILIFWDHGGGPLYGFGSDERDKNAAIGSWNVEKTFEKLDNNSPEWADFALVDYDACLMANIETAEAWSNNADFLLGSEDNAPGEGQYFIPWIYDLAVAAVNDKKDTEKKDLFGSRTEMAKIIQQVSIKNIDSYKEWYGKSKATLSLADLRTDDNGKGPMKDVDDHMEALSTALMNFLKKEPLKGYKAIFGAKKYGNKMSSLLSGIGDIKSYAGGLKVSFEELKNASDNTAIKETEAVITAADTLLKDFPDVKEGKVSDGKFVLYHQDTDCYGSGYYEGYLQPLGGMTMFFPYIDPSLISPYTGNNGGKWGEYLKLYYNSQKINRGYADYKDMIGTYLAVCEAGKRIKVIFDERKENIDESVQKEFIKNELKDCFSAFEVKQETQTALLNTLPGLMYEMTPADDDLDVYQKYENGEDYYYTEDSDRRDIFDGYYQNGKFRVQDPAAEGKEKILKLGSLPGGSFDSEKVETRLYNYNTENWIFLEYEENGEKTVFPAPIFDAIDENEKGNTMKDDLMVMIPGEYLIREKDANGAYSYDDIGYVLLFVSFEKGENEGEIIGYTDFDMDNPDTDGRFFNMEPLDENDMLLPVYGVYEKMMGSLDDPVRMYRSGEPDRTRKDLGAISPMQFNMIKPVRGTEHKGWDRELAEKIIGAEPADGSYGFDTPYVMRDVFQSEYELKKRENLTMEVKWKDGRDDASLVSEGTVIKPDDFRALVKVNGTEDEEKKREFESSILKNLILVTPDEKRLEFKSEYKIPAGSAVFIEIDSKLNVIDNLIEDFDKKSTEEQNRIRQAWEDYKLTPCPNGGLKIGIVKKTVSPDDEYSALDTRMKIVPYTEDTPIVMTMVKGQSCTFGNDSKGNWESSDPKKLSVNKKTGKVTAKGVTGDEEVILKDNVGNKEYHINIENPRIYLRQESEETGKTQYSIPANTITLTTGEDEYIYLDLMQDNSGDTAKEPKSLSTVNTAWISANPKIAEVTDNGKVTGVGKGSTKISGYVNGKAYSVTVKVTDVYSAATGNPKVLGQNRTSTEKPFEDTVFMNPGTTYTLKYDKKSGFNPKKGYWKTLDQEGKVIEENAPVTIDGKKAKVTAVKTGTVVFEGYATEEALKNDDQGPAVSLTVICRALPAKSVTYLNDASTAKKAPSEILKFYKVTNKKADQWISGNTEIATVDEKTGKVTAGTLKEAVWGYSDITCRNKDSVYKTRVYIEKPDVVWPETEDRIKINSKANTYDLELKAGEQFLISTPYVKQSLLWKSSKPGVAFVSEKGVIEGVAAGNNGKDAKAVVTAKVNGTQVKINVTVKSR